MMPRRYLVSVEPDGLRMLDTGAAVDPLTLYMTDPLRHLVWSSLYSDAQLSADEQPDRWQRGGWWTGVEYGSRLHAPAIRRGVLTPSTLTALRDAARDALTWLVSDGVAQSVEVSVARADGRALLTVTVTGPSTGVTGLRYAALWTAR